jgi:molybdopterin synthase catalytic subunit
LSRHDLIEVTDKPLTPKSVLSRLEWGESGALVTFTGRVRDRSGEKRVISLEHDAGTQQAGGLIAGIVSAMRDRWDLGAIAFCYRTGPVEAGGITALIAVASKHRPDAFEACQYAIDKFKQQVSARETLADD